MAVKYPEKDLLEIRVRNSYGDSFERELEDPTCSEVIHEFTQISQQLGYSLYQIYNALQNEAEEIKQAIIFDHKQLTGK